MIIHNNIIKSFNPCICKAIYYKNQFFNRMAFLLYWESKIVLVNY